MDDGALRHLQCIMLTYRLSGRKIMINYTAILWSWVLIKESSKLLFYCSFIYTLCHRVSHLWKRWAMNTTYSVDQIKVYPTYIFGNNSTVTYHWFESFWMYGFYPSAIGDLTWSCFWWMFIQDGRMSLELSLMSTGRYIEVERLADDVWQRCHIKLKK